MVFDLYIGPMAFFQTKHLWIKSLPDRVALLMLDRDQSAANFLDPKMLDDLDQALDALRKSDGHGGFPRTQSDRYLRRFL